VEMLRGGKGVEDVLSERGEGKGEIKGGWGEGRMGGGKRRTSR